MVRVFSGWADSAVWFSGPVAYADTRLERELVADLRSWDDGFYAALTSTYDWRSPDLAARYYRTGARLARRIAEQIGDDFQVQYDLGDAQRRVRGAGPARNQDAAAAFQEMAAQAKAEGVQMRQMVERAKNDGHALRWSADPPPHDHSPSPTSS